MKQRDNNQQPPNHSRNFRTDEMLSQSDVAFLLDIKNAGRISKWENGLSNPDLEHAITLGLIYHRFVEDIYFNLRKELAKRLAERKKLLREMKEKQRNKQDSD